MMGNEGNGGPGAGLRDLLNRKGVLPLLGGLVAVVVIGILLIAVASGGGGDGESVTIEPTRGPSDNAGLDRSPTAEAATPEPTIDLSRATAVVTRPETVPGSDAGDRIVIPRAGVNAPITLAVVPASGGELAQSVDAVVGSTRHHAAQARDLALVVATAIDGERAIALANVDDVRARGGNTTYA